MTFEEMIGTLGKDIGVELPVEGESCAFAIGGEDGARTEIVMYHVSEQGMVLTFADLGMLPPEPERLYRTMLEANDFFENTGGATLSLHAASGHARLQRADPLETLWRDGASKMLEGFCNAAAAWRQLIADFGSGALPEAGEGDGKGPADSPDSAMPLPFGQNLIRV